MKYLLDANVWLESATEGANAQEASDLISGAAPGQLATTDFVLHAIGIIVTTRAPEQFREFLDDLINRRVFTLHLTPSDLYSVLDCMRDNDLDFDDAFQYVAAERYDLRIVSFDKHFDRTPRGRITPAQALSEIQQRPQP